MYLKNKKTWNCNDSFACFNFSFNYKKEKDLVPVPLFIIGKWVGEFTNLGYSTKHFYSFNINEGGVLESLNIAGDKIGEGTCQLNGLSFTGSYTISLPFNSSYSMIGTLENPTKLSGSWGQGTHKTNGGFWNMAKQ